MFRFPERVFTACFQERLDLSSQRRDTRGNTLPLSQSGERTVPAYFHTRARFFWGETVFRKVDGRTRPVVSAGEVDADQRAGRHLADDLRAKSRDVCATRVRRARRKKKVPHDDDDDEAKVRNTRRTNERRKHRTRDTHTRMHDIEREREREREGV